MAKPLETVLYTARTHTTGGRDGAGRTDDGALTLPLSPPGSGRPGTNPEQLFGIGYSACFIGAMQLAGAKLGIPVPREVAVDAEVSLGKTDGGATYALGVNLHISLPGLPAEQQRQLVETAHQTCPYSGAIRGNIDVEFSIA
ncbi:Organic hydroperoxide resistance protein OhrB [Achromobacter deleyi]|uniref:Organic hydroperoxide resistance protein OhrB n=1 Tax=Achromobacter deleyi TaxID=1353891 RepID=A0A6S6ZV70_9BURK|nr:MULTISPECIES: organic hydroperoxide resistance protein [Achromobacter]CAB3698714.1 Organic hydroperoxide resistance protein OhrB [Achromobacter deleyi]CAB3852393.1 Organic hydroperoxide resistance protein OhrB [Achromobacter deleyi]CAB3875200.1 Organic hydroperoxide resistance protein OhrB [Achromobacter deleyi]CAB3902931.1 Organic hydroperoxide resistance protein OhrB [Achromobacter deleyi]